MSKPFSAVWNEDGSATVLGRISAADGSGVPTGVRGEGNWIIPADLASITCKVFDLDSDTPDTPIKTPAVVVADSVLNPPVTDGALWTRDDVGYNFRHDLGPDNFPEPRRYLVEYKGITNAGTVFHGVYKGKARPIRGS